MGIDYTAGVLFGTFAKSPAAIEKLTTLLDEADESETDLGEVRIVRHGNSYSGEYSYAISAGGHSCTSRGGGWKGPFVFGAMDEAKVLEAIRSHGLATEDFEPVGFYVYQDIW